MNKNTKKLWLLIIILIFIFPFAGQAAENYESLDKVLETFIDSRKTRILKEYGSSADKEAFIQKLEAEVYQPVDKKVQAELEKMPEYEGKKIMMDDFRTPGSDNSSVNTDRDLRVLVEVETDRWLEVPTAKWEDIYYQEFAAKTNFSPRSSSLIQQKKELKEHAEKFRQSPTDRFHLEASRDYSDQYGEAVPRIVKAKKGMAGLHDPEGLALMYMEKADDQIRRAERAASADLKAMHEAEALMQLKKGVISLEELRESYTKQGYEMGSLPENFKNIAAEIKSQDGSGKNLDLLKRRIKEAGFIDSSDFNSKLGSQLGSLKIAKIKKTAKKPIVSRGRALKSFSIISDLKGVTDSIEKVKQGSHIFFSYEDDDSTEVKLAKTSAAAALELLPLPLIEAADRGWKVDQEEKEFLQTMIASGSAGGWETQPLTSMLRVSTRIVSRTASSMTVDPILSGIKAVETGIDFAADSYDNYLTEFNQRESKELQQAKMKNFENRKKEFYLDKIYANIERGALVEPETSLNFYALKNDDWNNGFLIRWELNSKNGNKYILKESAGSDLHSEEIKFKAKNLPPAEYTVYLRAYDPLTMLQYNFADYNFTVTDYIDLGRLKISKDYYGNSTDSQDFTIGDFIYLATDRLGKWSNQYRVEWLYDGLTIKSAPASDFQINQIALKTENLKTGKHKIAVRILDSSNNIIAHRSRELNLENAATAEENIKKEQETKSDLKKADQQLIEKSEIETAPELESEPDYQRANLIKNQKQNNQFKTYSDSAEELNQKIVELVNNYSGIHNSSEIQKEVEKLLDQGADPNYRDGNYTIMHRAVMLGRLKTVEILINYGADVNALTSDHRKRSAVILAIGDAASDQALKSYVEKERLILVNRGEDKDVINMEIREYLKYLMLKLLIKNGADISQAEYSHDGIYHTSLSKAVTEAHPHIVELLLIEGAGEDQQIGELNFGRYNSLQEYVKNEIEEYTKVLAGNKYPENVRDLEYKINRYKKILKHLNDYEVPLINY